ncbi:hypothetical protein Tco_0062476 [Tanacetum coccineum]
MNSSGSSSLYATSPTLFTEEVIEFCTDYMKDVPSIGVPQSRHEGRLQGVGTIGRNMEPPNQDDLYRAHFTVLEDTSMVGYRALQNISTLVEKQGEKYHTTKCG